MDAEDIELRLKAAEASPGKKLFRKTGVEHDVSEAMQKALQSHQSPAAFIVLANTKADSSVGGNSNAGPTRQKETRNFVVIIALSKVNRKSVSLSTIRQKVIASLFGWKPDNSDFDPLRMSGGNMLSVKNGVLWAERFSTYHHQRSVN